jgi:hypothetical protein
MKKAVAFVGLLWLLAITLMAASANASTKLDATKVAWYLKGEGDVILPTLGQVLLSTKCQPTATKYVVCTNRSVTPDFKKSLCTTGKFFIKDFAVVGQFAKPKPCSKGPTA